jgi:class 3 adenylate cyclase/CHASE2 domain-containing sensor protein
MAAHGIARGVAIAAERTRLVERFAAAWDNLRRDRRRKGAFLIAVVGLIVAVLALLPTRNLSATASLERVAFDFQMRSLRAIRTRAIADDVVIVGIDDDTYGAYPEPFALWHRHSEAMLHALARAKPRAVGVDVVLPDHTYESILPGSDMALMKGMIDMKRAAPLVYVQTVSDKSQPVPIQKNYLGILGPANVGLDQQNRDPDLTSRQFDEHLGPTLTGQILRQLKIPVHTGFIDYTVGEPLEYVPMHLLAPMPGKVGLTDAELRKRLGGRIVLVGSVVGGQDRWRLPVRLMANDPLRQRDEESYDQPGVLIHAQVLRSHLADGPLQPLHGAFAVVLIALATCAVFISLPPLYVILTAIAVPVAVFGTGLAAIGGAQLVLPVATVIATFWVALLARGAFDVVEAVVERVRIHRYFKGQVSPVVMKQMLAGGLKFGVSGQLADVCVLFSDVRDFTTLSENMPPGVVTSVLQRYFDRMVHPVHRYNGTVDKFIGDGMMVLFGAPRESKDPCGEAVQCALGMMTALDSLNKEFEREGLPTLTIGIGINYGTVTVGNIGSSERHNYSAIGDAVNVAARVEGLTKDLGRKIIITEAVVSRIEERFHFDELGTHKVKGHSPVKVWGIRTSRAAPALADTMEVVRT